LSSNLESAEQNRQPQPEYLEFWNPKDLQAAKDLIVPDGYWNGSEPYLKTLRDLLSPAVVLALGTEKVSALEIGCGIGRLMKGMRNNFEWVYGIDISKEMLYHGNLFLSNTDNTTLMHCTGDGTINLVDEAVNFVYSVIVFQHIPSLPIIVKYLKESKRVLKEGGVVRIQTFKGAPNSKFNGFHGYFFPTLDSFASVFEAVGLKVIEKSEEDNYLWVTAQKTSTSSS
jgi:ubiquinone/menaquinone biosynthesis C-methylase UbiE